MKFKFYGIIGFLLLSLHTNANPQQQKPYNIEVNAPFLKGKMAYLASYWEDQTYVIDSIMIPDEGRVVFSKNESLPTGQYLLYIKPDVQLNLLLNEKEQNDIKIDVAQDIMSSEIEGSKDSKLFWNYILKSNELEEKKEQATAEIKKHESNQTAKKQAIGKYIAVAKEIDKYTTSQIEKNKGSCFSIYIKAMRPIATPHIYANSRDESVENARYASKHYFDNIDLTNVDMWKTSFFAASVNNYLENWIVQNIDTIAEKSSWLVAQTQQNDKAFEKMLSYLTNKSTNSKVMGEDNIWARLAEDYIFDKEVGWISGEQLNSLRAEYELIKLNRIGMKAQNLRLQTIAGDSINTNDLEAEYTVLYFYSTTCHHCREEIPLLKKDFFEANKNIDVKVIAINVEHNLSNWQEFVAEQGIQHWINAADPSFKSEYWIKYNTQGTPSLYLLDKNKTIIAKKINVESLLKIFERITEV